MANVFKLSVTESKGDGANSTGIKPSAQEAISPVAVQRSTERSPHEKEIQRLMTATVERDRPKPERVESGRGLVPANIPKRPEAQNEIWVDPRERLKSAKRRDEKSLFRKGRGNTAPKPMRVHDADYDSAPSYNKLGMVIWIGNIKLKHMASKTCRAYVKKLKKGSPAARCKRISIGDQLVSIADGTTLIPIRDLVMSGAWGVEEVGKTMSGPLGSKCCLTFQRFSNGDWNEEYTVAIERVLMPSTVRLRRPSQSELEIAQHNAEILAKRRELVRCREEAARARGYGAGVNLDRVEPDDESVRRCRKTLVDVVDRPSRRSGSHAKRAGGEDAGVSNAPNWQGSVAVHGDEDFAGAAGVGVLAPKAGQGGAPDAPSYNEFVRRQAPSAPPRRVDQSLTREPSLLGSGAETSPLGSRINEARVMAPYVPSAPGEDLTRQTRPLQGNVLPAARLDGVVQRGVVDDWHPKKDSSWIRSPSAPEPQSHSQEGITWNPGQAYTTPNVPGYVVEEDGLDSDSDSSSGDDEDDDWGAAAEVAGLMVGGRVIEEIPAIGDGLMGLQVEYDRSVQIEHDRAMAQQMQDGEKGGRAKVVEDHLSARNAYNVFATNIGESGARGPGQWTMPISPRKEEKQAAKQWVPPEEALARGLHTGQGAHQWTRPVSPPKKESNDYARNDLSAQNDVSPTRGILTAVPAGAATGARTWTRPISPPKKPERHDAEFSAAQAALDSLGFSTVLPSRADAAAAGPAQINTAHNTDSQAPQARTGSGVPAHATRAALPRQRLGEASSVERHVPVPPPQDRYHTHHHDGHDDHEAGAPLARASHHHTDAHDTQLSSIDDILRGYSQFNATSHAPSGSGHSSSGSGHAYSGSGSGPAQTTTTHTAAKSGVDSSAFGALPAWLEGFQELDAAAGSYHGAAGGAR